MAEEISIHGVVALVTEDKPTSFLQVVFDETNSVNIKSIVSEGVSPLQLIAIAQYLEILGKNQLVTQINERLEAQRQQNLAVPKPHIVVAGGK